jgi:hypothetical protein
MPENAPGAREPSNQRSIITHAVFVGLTPLIPIPLVDDVVKNYFQRRMVRQLSASRGRTLSAADAAALVEERGDGCLKGCMWQALVYPLKKIFRKIFFFLEWKRAVDLTSRTYHQGYLLDYVLREGWLGEPPPAGSAARIGAAIEEVCRNSPIKPVEAAISLSFKQSKAVLRSGVKILERSLNRFRGRPDEGQLSEAVTAIETEEERQIEGVVNKLQKAIEAIPDEHFRQLRTQLMTRLQAQTRPR